MKRKKGSRTLWIGNKRKSYQKHYLMKIDFFFNRKQFPMTNYTGANRKCSDMRFKFKFEKKVVVI